MSGEVVAAAGAVSSSRWFHLNAKKAFVMVSVAGAVAAAAVAVLSGQMFAAVGYGLFGMTSLWMLFDEGAAIAEVRGLERDLSGKEREIIKSTKEIQGATAQLNALGEQYQRGMSRLGLQVADLGAANGQLASLESVLGSDREKMEAEIKKLVEKNGKLMALLQVVQKNFSSLKGEMGKLVGEKGALEKGAAAILEAELAVDDEKVNLEGLRESYDARFDEDFAQLTDLVKRFGVIKGELETLVKQFGDERSERERGLKTREEKLKAGEEKLDRDRKAMLRHLAEKTTELEERFKKKTAEADAALRKAQKAVNRLSQGEIDVTQLKMKVPSSQSEDD